MTTYRNLVRQATKRAITVGTIDATTHVLCHNATVLEMRRKGFTYELRTLKEVTIGSSTRLADVLDMVEAESAKELMAEPLRLLRDTDNYNEA